MQRVASGTEGLVQGNQAVLLGLVPDAVLTMARSCPPSVPAMVTESVAAELTAQQEQLLLDHLSMVRYVAWSIHERLPQHIELDELVGAGTLGLLDAARKFNATKNVQFRSYAQFRIRGAILDSLRSLDWSPRELRRKGRAMEEADRALQGRLGRPAQDTELAREMGIPLAELQQLAGKLRGLQVASLHAERGEDSGDDELASLPARESDNPLFQCLQHESRQRVVDAIDALSERERLVMTLYYFEEMTMKEIGQILNVVESRVSQIHHLAVSRMRHLLSDLRRTPGGKLQPAFAARRAS